MLKMLRGIKAGRRGLVVGCLVAGVGASAVGAAAGHPVWTHPARAFVDSGSSAEPPATDAPVTTDAPATTEPVTTEPAATETAPPSPPAPPVTEPAPPPHNEPVVTDPPTTEAAPEAPATEPAPPPAEDPAPAPSDTPDTAPPTTVKHDDVVPATLSLACALTDGSNVACSWSGEQPAGFAKYALLRGDPDGKGRVPYMSPDGSVTSFLDTTASAGSHSYVLVALDAAAHPLAHSNMVHIEIAAA